MKIFSRKRALVLAVLMAAALAVHASAMADETFTLDAIHAGIVKKYDGVVHMTSKELIKKLGTRKDVVLFDVRERAEYDVSHVPGAKQVDPGIWHRPFMNRYAKTLKGKTVVFYCSVGVRSSKLAKYVQAALKQNGAKAVYNLQGGIFNWHNESRPLADNNGPTTYVHPFDKNWGRLVSNRNLTRFKAEK